MTGKEFAMEKEKSSGRRHEVEATYLLLKAR